MLKSAPRIMAIVLLVAIAVLMVIAGGSGFTELFKKGVEANTNDKGGNNTPIIPGDQPEDPPVIPPITSSKFPKQPSASDLFAYTQTVEADSALKLEAVHQTALGILIVVSGASAAGDFTVERQSVTVINMSEDGTLNKCLTLSSASPTYYVTSQLTTDGLVVAVKDAKNCFLYILDYELKTSIKMDFETVTSARIFPLSESFMFLAESTQNTVYLIKDEAVQKSAVIQAGNVLEIIELRSTLNIFINGINGYSVISLDKDLNGFSQISVPNYRALKVLPITEKGSQKYLVVELQAGQISISKHTASFRENDCVRVGVAKAEGANIYHNGSTIFLMLKGNSRVYLVDMNLDFNLSSSTLYQNINDIYGCEGYDEGYLMLSRSGSSDRLTLTDIRNDGSVSTKTVSIAADKAEFVRNLNGTIGIIYTSTANANSVCIAGISL